MNYKPGQKVKVNVNGAEWEDEIECFDDNVPISTESNPEVVKRYRLKSGFSATVSALTTIDPDIKPEPGDIVEVWDKGESHKVQIFDEMHNEVFSCHDLKSLCYTEWDCCRVLARKPKRWEDIDSDERIAIQSLAHYFANSTYGNEDRCEAYDKLLSFIIGVVPYARIGE